MKVIRSYMPALRIYSDFILVAIFALMLLLLPNAPAHAASLNLCAPSTANGAVGPRRYTNPNTSTSYTTNGQGCVVAAAADVGWFLSQGFALGSPYGAMESTGNAAAFSMILPVGTFIRDIIFNETSGSSINSLQIGTTSGGVDVLSGGNLPASGLVFTPEVSRLKSVFPSTSPPTTHTLYFSSGTSAWLGLMNVTIVYGYY